MCFWPFVNGIFNIQNIIKAILPKTNQNYLEGLALKISLQFVKIHSQRNKKCTSKIIAD